MLRHTPVEPHLPPLLPHRLAQAVASLGGRRGIPHLLLLSRFLLRHFLLKGLDLHLQPLLGPSASRPRRRSAGRGRAGLVHSVSAQTHREGKGLCGRWRRARETKPDRHIWIDFSSLTLTPPRPPPHPFWLTFL